MPKGPHDDLVDRKRPEDLLSRALRLKCTACGRAPAFDSLVRMKLRCPQCGFYFERETGYFLGAMYINYGVAVAITVGLHLVLADVFSMGSWTQFAILIPLAILLVLWFFRYSRMLWLALDLAFDPPKKSDYEARPEIREREEAATGSGS
jgi:uncharacterized protein (DUF983 family)